MQDRPDIAMRQKRPERPLYVPPAQRHRPQTKKAVIEPTSPQTHSHHLCDLLEQQLLFSPLFPTYKSHTRHKHNQCAFRKILQHYDPGRETIKIYDTNICYDTFYRLDHFELIAHETNPTLYRAVPCADFDIVAIDDIQRVGVLVANVGNEPTRFDEETAHCICRQRSGIDCLYINLDCIQCGHLLLITYEKDYLFRYCQTDHDFESCAIQLLETIQQEKVKKCTQKIAKRPMKSDSNEHEKEKEIMVRTQENINRRSKPIMKYIQYKNETLEIDKNDDSVNNWEELIDHDEDIHQERFTEDNNETASWSNESDSDEDRFEVHRSSGMCVGRNDDNFEHIVELYDFPASLETCHLIQAFSELNSDDSMYVKWVDDTHALLVLGSSTQAQRAVNMKNALIKARTMATASAAAVKVAAKSNLKPAMKRPLTNLQTARRLITTHLGRKSAITKEQSDREKQDLRNAREQKRLNRQKEADAWEGRIHSSIK